MEKEAESFNLSGNSGIMLSDDSHLVKEAKVGQDTSRSIESSETSSESGHKNVEKGSKKKKGKSGGNAKSSASESAADDPEYIPTKSKKNQRRGKDTSSSQVSGSKPGAKKDGGKMQDDNLNVPSEEWVIQKIMMLNPDFEEQGLLIFYFILANLAYSFYPTFSNGVF